MGLTSAVDFDLPPTTPAMILPGVVLFPGMLLPLHIFEPRYRQMLDDVLSSDRTFAIVPSKPGSTDDTPHSIGCVGMVRVSVQNRDDTSNLFLLGFSRVRILDLLPDNPYPVLRIQALPDKDDSTLRTEAHALRLKEIVRARLREADASNTSAPAGLSTLLETDMSAGRLTDLVAHTLIPDRALRQDLLGTASVTERLRKLISFFIEKS